MKSSYNNKTVHENASFFSFQITFNAWYCRDRVSSCNIYMLSNMIHKVVVRVLQHKPNLQIQLVQNAPDDGPVRSETCGANIKC